MLHTRAFLSSNALRMAPEMLEETQHEADSPPSLLMVDQPGKVLLLLSSFSGYTPCYLH